MFPNSGLKQLHCPLETCNPFAFLISFNHLMLLLPTCITEKLMTCLMERNRCRQWVYAQFHNMRFPPNISVQNKSFATATAPESNLYIDFDFVDELIFLSSRAYN